jgi:hypothetical protein
MENKYKHIEKYLSSDPSVINEVEGKYGINDNLGKRKKQEILESVSKEIQKSYDFAIHEASSFFKNKNDLDSMKIEICKKINEIFTSI